MIQLTINNSMSRIDGLSIPEMRALRDILSYSTSAQSQYFSGGFGNPKRYLIDKKGSFPSGLLYLVDGWLKGKHHSVTDYRRLPASTVDFKSSLGLTPYPEQREAALSCIARYRGIISAPTGSGKSVIISLIIKALGVRTLVVVPSLELKRQLSETLEKTFGIKTGPGKDLWVENVDGLSTKKKLVGYDCVIIDEFHRSAAKTYRTLNEKCWDGVFYRFGTSATPFRSQDHERLLLESVLSEVIYKLEYDTAVSKGYIVPIEAYYYELPKVKNQGTNWASVYSELVVKNEHRNQLISTVMGKLHKAGKSTLCLVREIAHGDRLSALTYAAFANGKSEDCPLLIDAFSRTKLTTLIGTTGVLGEGVDTKPCEYVIIAGLGKSRNQFMQQCGRAFRVYPGKESCKVILFKDASHRWSLSHFKAQCKVLLEEYGVVPVKLDTLT